MKRCCKCGESKDTSEFWKHSQRPDGLHSMCKRCCRAARRVDALSVEQRERRRSSRAAWKAAHPEQVKEYARRSYENHHQSRLNRATQYRAAHAEQIREYFQQLRITRPGRIPKDKCREYSAQWRERNLEMALQNERDSSRRRRARMAMVENTLSKEEWGGRVAEFDKRCAYCLLPCDTLTLDHFRPLARGGGHTLENTVPACSSCNSSKKDALVFNWIARGVGVCLPSTST